MGTWFRWLWGWRGEVGWGYQQGHGSALSVSALSINDGVDRRVDACEGEGMFVAGRAQGRPIFWPIVPMASSQMEAPSKEVQTGYFEAVKAITREYVSYLSAEDLEKRVVFPPTALRQEHTLGTALGQLVLESVAHGGQIAYLRGFHRGMGWYR